jgi:hypothetical protein
MKKVKKITYKGVEYYSGDQIICTIDSRDVGQASIYIDPNRENKLYICHNAAFKHGAVSPDLLGYDHSWVTSIYNESDTDILTDGVDIIGKFYENVTIKPDVIIQDELSIFFQNEKAFDIIQSFKYDVKIFSEFDKYEISETKGFIKVSSSTSTKHMDVKFGRLVRTLLIEFRKLTGISTVVENKFIEDLHNKFVACQTNGIVQFETWSGDKLLNGYTTDNYFEKKSTLGNSCMNNNLGFLEIYTKNPNNIELLVLILFGKVAARCIVWTDNDGKKYHDRIYHIKDWLNNSMLNKCKELGYECIYTLKDEKTIKLEEWTFNEYPYMDTLSVFNHVKGEISNFTPRDFKREEMKTMRKTNGSLGTL